MDIALSFRKPWVNHRRAKLASALASTFMYATKDSGPLTVPDVLPNLRGTCHGEACAKSAILLAARRGPTLFCAFCSIQRRVNINIVTFLRERKTPSMNAQMGGSVCTVMSGGCIIHSGLNLVSGNAKFSYTHWLLRMPQTKGHIRPLGCCK